MSSSEAPARPLLWVLVLLSMATACGAPAREEPVELETVDVGQPIDAELSTEGDQQAVAQAAGISGLVPGDVPPDLPLPTPASVVDFGAPAGARPWVELDTGQPLPVVRRWLGERLPAAGWTVGAVGDNLVEAAKGRQRVVYRLTDLAPGTRIRLEYEGRR